MGSTIKNQCSRHLETNQLICYADQLTGVKMVNAKYVKVTAKIGSNIFLEFWQVLVRFSQNWPQIYCDTSTTIYNIQLMW